MTSIKFSNIRYKGFVDEKYFVDEFLNLLDAPNELFKREEVVLIKNDRASSTVAELPVFINGTKRILIVKRWNKSNIKRMIRTAKRPLATWNNVNKLQSLGIPTAYPVAVLERKKFSFFYKSFFISEKILNSMHLIGFSRLRFKDLNKKSQIILDVARLVKQLHDLGIYHNDLGPTNIMVQENNEDSRIYLTDIDAIKFNESIGKEERLDSLARILLALSRLTNIDRNDIKAFLNEYSNNNEEFKLHKSLYIKQIRRHILIKWGVFDFLSINNLLKFD